MVHNMKNHYVYLSFAKMSAALCLLATGTLVSCTEDAMPGLSYNDDVLRFSLSEKNWNKVTKGRTGTDFDNYTVGVVALQDDNKEDSLFLHIQLSDGMNGMSIAQNRLDTKAGPVETADFYESFGVLTSIYSGAWNETTCLPDYMYNVEVTKESSWTTRYFWPGANRNIRFFAYAPYNGDGVSLSAATEKRDSISYIYSTGFCKPAKRPACRRQRRDVRQVRSRGTAEILSLAHSCKICSRGSHARRQDNGDQH